MKLVGDIGGTKTNLALFDDKKKKIELVSLMTLPSKDYPDLISLISDYQKKQNISGIEGASLAIAGPVKNGICKATNLPWIVNAQKIADSLKVQKVSLLNDLEANAWSIDILEPDQVYELYAGKKNEPSNRAVVSPGTGLGEAGVYWDGKKYHPIASEGGHCEFGPRNEKEMELCKYLQQRYQHSSYERLLSGAGLVNIYQFLRDVLKLTEPEWLTEMFKHEDNAKAITEAALKNVEICNEALTLFVSILGSESGNCALKWMAYGGVYLGGGIPPKILHFLKTGNFLNGFFDKGRLRYVLEQIPVRVILEPKASLLGAAFFISQTHYC